MRRLLRSLACLPPAGWFLSLAWDAYGMACDASARAASPWDWPGLVSLVSLALSAAFLGAGLAWLAPLLDE